MGSLYSEEDLERLAAEIDPGSKKQELRTPFVAGSRDQYLLGRGIGTPLTRNAKGRIRR